MICFWFCLPPNPTQALVAQGETQGSDTGKYGVFTGMQDSGGCRECSNPSLVILEEGGLHVSVVGTGIDS